MSIFRFEVEVNCADERMAKSIIGDRLDTPDPGLDTDDGETYTIEWGAL